MLAAAIITMGLSGCGAPPSDVATTVDIEDLNYNPASLFTKNSFDELYQTHMYSDGEQRYEICVPFLEAVNSLDEQTLTAGLATLDGQDPQADELFNYLRRQCEGLNIPTTQPATKETSSDGPLSYDAISLFTVSSFERINDTFRGAPYTVKREVCDNLKTTINTIGPDAMNDGVKSLSSQQAGMGKTFQDLYIECLYLKDPEPTKEPTPTSTLAYVYTPDQVFSSAVGDILNAFDLGDRTEKLKVCTGVSNALAGFTDRQIEDRSNRMDYLDFTILEDLARDCATLVGLK